MTSAPRTGARRPVGGQTASSAANGLGGRLFAVVLAVAAVATLLLWLASSLVHLDDRERVGHVQGAWMALARYANDGILYPPLYDGERYGGTRWMPLGIILHAGAARLVGSELVGGKGLTLILTLALLGVALALLRRLGCSWPIAAALVAAVLASHAGLFTTRTIGGDVLPVALQVGAVLLALRGNGPAGWAADWETGGPNADPGPFGDRRMLFAAAVLAGLAPVAKLTGGWAALAIACRLFAMGRWRELGAFVAVASGTAAGGLALALLASGGRLWDSVGRFAFAGGTGPVAILRGPNQVVYNLTEFAPGLLAVAPLALGAILLARGWQGLSTLDWALGWGLLALVVAFTDIGTGLNQLLDLLVLLVLVAAQLPQRLADAVGGRSHSVGAAALGLAALVALGAGLVMSLVPAARTAVDVARHGHPLDTVPLEQVLEPHDTLLSEDPYVPVAHDRDPVVLDAFMIRRLDEVRPDLVDPLIERIEDGAFDYVLLLEDLEADEWWERYHFGPRVVAALRQAYEPDGGRDGYLVYRPRR